MAASKLADKMQNSIRRERFWLQRWLFDVLVLTSRAPALLSKYKAELEQLKRPAQANDKLLKLIKSVQDRRANCQSSAISQALLEDMLLEYSTTFG